VWTDVTRLNVVTLKELNGYRREFIGGVGELHLDGLSGVVKTIHVLFEAKDRGTPIGLIGT
jgi:hypothetical protein